MDVALPRKGKDKLRGPPSTHYAVATDGLYKGVDREKFFKDELSKNVHANGIRRWENPFSFETFPWMNDINYSVMFRHGELNMARASDDYEKSIREYRATRYIHKDDVLVNKGVTSITMPRLYNVVTGTPIKATLDYHLDHNTELIIKVVDLGEVCFRNRFDREEGNLDLSEIYNEIRVGFFLNELLYAYKEVVTRHFMQVVDWFVSDINLYPVVRGDGPYQYIVSEKLDFTLTQFLFEHSDMLTLRCTLFCVAHALEAAWFTHEYLHFDLHSGNIMVKKVAKKSACHGKHYLYTRPDKITKDTYKLPKEGVHNALVKIIDFGRNRMSVPMNSRTDRDLYEHIEKGANPVHNHKELLKYEPDYYGIGVKNNRIFDMRRILWDMVMEFSASYWDGLKKHDPDGYKALMDQIELFIDMTIFNDESGKEVSPIHEDLVKGKKGKTPQFTIEDIIDLKIRGEYIVAKEKDKKIEKFVPYIEWYKRVRRAVVFREEAIESPNVETFLSSVLFDAFRVANPDIDMETSVWIGQSPFVGK